MKPNENTSEEVKTVITAERIAEILALVTEENAIGVKAHGEFPDENSSDKFNVLVGLSKEEVNYAIDTFLDTLNAEDTFSVAYKKLELQLTKRMFGYVAISMWRRMKEFEKKFEMFAMMQR